MQRLKRQLTPLTLTLKAETTVKPLPTLECMNTTFALWERQSKIQKHIEVLKDKNWIGRRVAAEALGEIADMGAKLKVIREGKNVLS